MLYSHPAIRDIHVHMTPKAGGGHLKTLILCTTLTLPAQSHADSVALDELLAYVQTVMAKNADEMRDYINIELRGIEDDINEEIGPSASDIAAIEAGAQAARRSKAWMVC